jgi:hypothetical protein
LPLFADVSHTLKWGESAIRKASEKLKST